jgi:hypothetical protein
MHVVVLVAAQHARAREQIFCRPARRAAPQQDSPSPLWLWLFRTLFFTYPMATMWLLVLAVCEVVVRRFIYYRLLSIAVITDWTTVTIFSGWFTLYFIASAAVLNYWAWLSYSKVWYVRSSYTVVAAAWTTLATQTFLTWYVPSVPGALKCRTHWIAHNCIACVAHHPAACAQLRPALVSNGTNV